MKKNNENLKGTSDSNDAEECHFFNTNLQVYKYMEFYFINLSNSENNEFCFSIAIALLYSNI